MSLPGAQGLQFLCQHSTYFWLKSWLEHCKRFVPYLPMKLSSALEIKAFVQVSQLRLNAEVKIQRTTQSQAYGHAAFDCKVLFWVGIEPLSLQFPVFV